MNWMERRKRAARRRLGARAGLLLGAVGGVLAAVGWCLPAEAWVSAQLELARAPETVWSVLMDLDGMPLWRSDLSAVERLPDLEGHPAWREVRRGGEAVVELAAADPPHRLVFRETRAGRSTRPSSTFVLTGSRGRTLVTLTQQVEIRNPLRRVLHRVHPTRSALVRLLRELRARVGGAPPQVAAAAP